VARDPRDPAAREDTGLLGELVGRARVNASTDAAILAFGVFADADDIDVGRGASAEGRGDSRQQPDRTEIYVLDEAPPKRKKQLASRNVVGHFRIADRAEIDRVELRELLDRRGIHHAAGAEIDV